MERDSGNGAALIVMEWFKKLKNKTELLCDYILKLKKLFYNNIKPVSLLKLKISFLI